jgi:hypothetical protein
MARPRKPIDPVQVAALARLHLSYDEIGAVVGCTASTLSRRFGQAIQKGRLLARADLKRTQFDAALGLTFQDQDGRIYQRRPDRTMLVWLGKTVLGQGGDSEPDLGSADMIGTAAPMSDRERVLRILGVPPTFGAGADDAPSTR